MRPGSAKAAAPLGLSIALAALLLSRIVWDGAAPDAVPLTEIEDPPPVAEEMAEPAEAPATITLPPPPVREKPVEVAAPAPAPFPEAPPPVEAARPPAPTPVPEPGPETVPALEPLRSQIIAEATPVPHAMPEPVDAPTPLRPQPQPQLPSEPVETPEPEPPVALSSQPQPAPLPAVEAAEVAETPQPLAPAPQPAPEPTPAPAPAVAPEPPAPPVRAADPPPAPAQAAAPPTPDPVVDETVLAEGRPLLRILEHGSGPVIEIAWPDGQAARERLYETFTTCFGMRVAVMDRDGALYASKGRAGTPWAVNLDRYSGFVRQPAGRLARAEMGEAERALAHHGAALRASPVRVFPRRVDALLLGGLRRIAGERYGGAARIRATYGLDGRRVFVTGISVDGRPLAGRIDLTLAALARCR